MQTFTKIEIQWLIQAINHQIEALEEIIRKDQGVISTGLCNLRREELFAMKDKLETALKNNEKRIEITY